TSVLMSLANAIATVKASVEMMINRFIFLRILRGVKGNVETLCKASQGVKGTIATELRNMN
ncbi:MAG: hypothetical protein J6W69_07570, partial [Bacteroidales bacterium]|nr:hypothetical protein [Bacteroidales bacterium]